MCATLTDAPQVAKAETEEMCAKVRKLEQKELLPLALPEELRWDVFAAYLDKEIQAKNKAILKDVENKFRDAKGQREAACAR